MYIVIDRHVIDTDEGLRRVGSLCILEVLVSILDLDTYYIDKVLVFSWFFCVSAGNLRDINSIRPRIFQVIIHQ